jgi:hypothetical protein
MLMGILGILDYSIESLKQATTPRDHQVTASFSHHATTSDVGSPALEVKRRSMRV